MTIPSVEKVETFDENLDSAEDFVNSSAETFTTHTGLTRQTITGVINSAVQRPIVPFDDGDAYPDDSVWVEQPPSGGAIYRPKPSALPIAAGPFDPDDWVLAQLRSITLIDTTEGILTDDSEGVAVYESKYYDSNERNGTGAVWIFTGTTTPGSAGTENVDSGLIYNASGREYKFAGDSFLQFFPQSARDSVRAYIGQRRDPYVVAASGQSNMMGRGVNGPMKINENVLVWDGTANGGAGGFITSDLTSSVATSGSSFGGTLAGGDVRNNWAVSLCHRIQEETGRPVYLILDGQTSTPISEWVAAGTASARYAGWTDAVDDGVAALGVDRVDLILWHQGENDSALSADAYWEKLQTLRTQLRAEAWADGHTPFMAANMLVPSGPDQALQYLNYDGNPRTMCVSVESFSPDGTGHVSGEDLYELGYTRAWGVLLNSFGNAYRTNEGATQRQYAPYTRADASTGMYERAGSVGTYDYRRGVPDADNNYTEDEEYRIYPGVGGYMLIQAPATTADYTANGLRFTPKGDTNGSLPEIKYQADKNEFWGYGVFLEQPTLQAFLSSNTTVTAGSVVIFDNIDSEEGSNYDNTTGVYTVPVSGRWEINVVLTLEGSLNTETYWLSLLRSSSAVSRMRVVNPEGDPQIVLSYVGNFNATQTISLQVRGGGNSADVPLLGGFESYMSIKLVS